MDQQTAKLIIVAGGGVGVFVWLIAINLYRKLAAAESPRRFESLVRNRQPAEAIDSLLQRSEFFSAQARLERVADNRLAVRQAGVELDVEATRQGGDTRLVATVDDSTLTHRFQLGLGALVLILMPIVIGGVVAALWYLVAPSEKPPVRWQAFQVVQIVHVLWPPFLAYFIWKRLHVQAGNAAANLTALASAGPVGRE